MAIADSMVRLMNGQILVESEEGKGTEFSVYLSLPVAEMQDEKETSIQNVAEEDPEMLRAIEAFTLKGIRILLAEDNDINAEIAMEILAMEGAILTRACDGEEVVQMFKESQPYSFDVILMGSNKSNPQNEQRRYRYSDSGHVSQCFCGGSEKVTGIRYEWPYQQAGGLR